VFVHRRVLWREIDIEAIRRYRLARKIGREEGGQIGLGSMSNPVWWGFKYGHYPETKPERGRGREECFKV